MGYKPYVRVIPRDLFNEANLLKCYGRLYIALETANAPHVELEVHDDWAFNILQDDDSGAITVSNVTLTINGQPQHLFRPMNSREAWPLFIERDFEEIPVFDGQGNFSAEMLHLLESTKSAELKGNKP